MDPISIALMGAGVLGNIFGLSQSSKANKKYDHYLNQMNNRLDGWYNKEINTNYLDTDEAKSVLRLLQEQAKEVSGDLESSAAITGASAEKQVATKDKLNKNYANAATSLAGRGTQRKDMIRNQYMNRQGQLDQMGLQNLQQKSQNWNQFGANASGLAQNGLMLGAMGGEFTGSPLSALLNRGKNDKMAIAGMPGMEDAYGNLQDWMLTPWKK